MFIRHAKKIYFLHIFDMKMLTSAALWIEIEKGLTLSKIWQKIPRNKELRRFLNVIYIYSYQSRKNSMRLNIKFQTNRLRRWFESFFFLLLSLSNLNRIYAPVRILE